LRSHKLAKAKQDKIMLCYAIFDLLPTHGSLLMEDIALGVFGTLAFLLLSALVAGLMVILGLIILLPTYLLGFLQPVMRKIALRLLNKFAPSNRRTPALFNLVGGRFGLQSGAQAADFIFPFPNEQALEGSPSSKFTLGSVASVVAEPVGRQAGASTDLKLSA
jgi:hypothetical protein